MRPHLPTTLLCLAALAASAHAAQECLTTSINQVGQCAAFQGSEVQTSLERELGGKEPAWSPPPFNADLVATRIWGDMATGQAWPIATPPHEKTLAQPPNGSSWILLIQKARFDTEGRLFRYPSEENHEPDDLVVLRYTAPNEAQASAEPSRPILQVLGRSRITTSPQDAPHDGSAGNSNPGSAPPCHTPDGDAPHNTPGNALSPPFAWVAVGSHWLLSATSTLSEGYAGGGGTFTSRVLMTLHQGTLRPIACYSVENYQLFGGAWNPDGSRGHTEQLSRWAMQVQPARKPARSTTAQASDNGPAADAWPDLLLNPLTAHTRAGRMRWNEAKGFYEPVSHQRGTRP